MTDLRATLDAHLGDRYEVVRELGAGGMATVFLATDTKHGREVALKVLRPEVAGAVGAERFLREIETVARLTHPHILPLHDSGEAGGLLYYVMPYVEGETLRERLEREGALPIEEALRIARECAEALEHAHRAGIIHRDLKPANILFSGGHAVVADFGIGRAVQGVEDDEPLTRTGISLGTVGYMSPEQGSGEQAVDARSDVYALGCVLYEMLTGERAFPGRTTQAVLARQLTGTPPAVSVLRRSVPGAVERVVQKALQPTPADRHGSAAEFAADLRAARQADEPAATRTAASRGRRPAVAAAAVLILGALAYGGFVFAGGDSAEVGPPEITSLAVLPLDNLSPDPEAEQYFADAMTEALTAELARINALSVRGRTSAMQFRATDKAIPEIAAALGVDALIEGSVQRAGDQVRVTVQLVHGLSDRHLWTETYESDFRDILALQGQIARAVAEEIRVAVSPKEEARLIERRAVDPEAHTLYLRANHELAKGDEASIRRALDYYRQAIALDSTYAPVHAGLARAYINLTTWRSSEPPTAVRGPAREAALRAIALDSTLAEGHIALARFEHLFEWDWDAAEAAFRRGMSLNPSAPDALLTYANYLNSMGRGEDALSVIRRALEIDPLSPGAHIELGLALWLLGRPAEALKQDQQTLDLWPDHIGEIQIAHSLAALGRFGEALVHAQRFEREVGEGISPYQAGRLGALYVMLDRRDDALRILSQLERRAEREWVPPLALAMVEAALGQKDQALDHLEQAYAVRDPGMVWLGLDQLFSNIRDEPRFQDLLRRMDFPEG